MIKENFISLIAGQDQSLIIIDNQGSDKNYLNKMIAENLGVNKEDVVVFSPEDGVAQLRKGIAGFQLKPNTGSKKLFIVEGVDLLNKEQANTLLKTIEEPPKHGKIILIGENKAKIIKTILSRCHLLRAPSLNKYERESILNWIRDLTFKDFVNKIKTIERAEAISLLGGGLEELRQKGLNKAKGQIFKEIGNSLALVGSTNCGYKLALERLYIFIKFREK
jgi:DNA polymerase III delta prime subunit